MRLSVIFKVHPKLVSFVFFVFWVEKYVSVCWYLVELVSNKLQKLEDAACCCLCFKCGLRGYIEISTLKLVCTYMCDIMNIHSDFNSYFKVEPLAFS